MASVKIRNRPTRATTPAEWVGVEFVGDAGHPTWHGRRFKILPQSTSNALIWARLLWINTRQPIFCAFTEGTRRIRTGAAQTLNASNGFLCALQEIR